MAHALIASPFLDGHLLLKPGARAGARIPADHYEGLRQAAADGESFPPGWYRRRRCVGPGPGRPDDARLRAGARAVSVNHASVFGR
ncbi:hypothetical protein FHX79_111596 [Streptomyces cavourensis]|nr:hypothetical protein FHX79_111596 [Streptomyces cavourensis]